MHQYSIDTKERRYISLILVIISILLAWSFHKILIYYKLVLPWWLDAPSIVFFYGVLFTIFDKFCWKWKIFHKINFIKTPNLNGEWLGFIQSSFDEHSSKVEATLKIFQSWAKIKILLSTDQSSSYSESASIVINTPEGIFLNYQYINEPKANTQKTMHIHRGTARLLLKENTLTGEYYSGRDRENFGIINFKRK